MGIGANNIIVLNWIAGGDDFKKNHVLETTNIEFFPRIWITSIEIHTMHEFLNINTQKHLFLNKNVVILSLLSFNFFH